MIVFGIDRFIDGGFSKVIPQIIQTRSYEIQADVNTYFEIGAWLVLALFFVIVQFRGTAKGYSHKSSKEQNMEQGYMIINSETN